MAMIVMLLGGIAAASIWLVVLQRWQRGVRLLMVFLPVAGMLSLLLDVGGAGKLLKDVLFVVPIYAGLLLTQPRQVQAAPVPGLVWLVIAMLAVLTLLQTMNPNLLSPLVALVGLKLWLFYIPMMLVAGAYLNSERDLIRLLRLMVGVAFIPVLFALAQYWASAVLGYQSVMTAIYGGKAAAVTQGFAQFSYGVGLFGRIPSTFASSVEFYGYALSVMPVAYALGCIDPSRRWRLAAWLCLGLTVVAYVLAGSRAALYFVPLLVLMILVFDGRLSKAMSMLLAVPALIVAVLFVAGINPGSLLTTGARLAETYGESIVVEEFLKILRDNPFGLGTGMNAVAARHVAPGITEAAHRIYEGTFNKALNELGILGPVVVLLLFASVAGAGVRVRRRLAGHPLRSCAAALVAYIIVMAIVSTKGWVLDLDPTNILFWFYAGIMFKLPDLAGEPLPAAVARPGRAPYGPSWARPYEPALPPQPPPRAQWRNGPR